LFAFCCVYRGTAAFAALGLRESSIAREAKALNATSTTVVPSGLYTEHDLVAANGVTIREYVAGGVVFAVKWRGNVKPDLSQLLGNSSAEYLEAYTAALAAPRRSLRGPLQVRTSTLVGRHEGHMRDWRGLVYDSTLVPNGVDPEALP
jgi:hypothetical protein